MSGTYWQKMDSWKTYIIEGRHGTVIKEVMKKWRMGLYVHGKYKSYKYMSLDYSDENDDGMEWRWGGFY